MPKRRSLPIFEDQGEKLFYLLHTRGDQREPDPNNSQVAKGERVRRGVHDYPSLLVHTQGELAIALGLEEARVSDWITERMRIPSEKLAEICRIFAVDQLAFRILPFAPFKLFVETGFIDPEWSRWRRLVGARAATRGLHLLTRDPFDVSVSKDDDPTRFARRRQPGSELPLPTIAAATPFWLAVRSPQDADGAPVWSGWHVMALNHDDRTDGFACSLVPAGDATGSGEAVFPPDVVTYCLPRHLGLEHDVDDRGVFTMIVLVTREPLPAEIAGPLARDEARGLAIEVALRQLSIWLEAEGWHDAAAMRCVRYRVVAPPYAAVADR